MISKWQAPPLWPLFKAYGPCGRPNLMFSGFPASFLMPDNFDSRCGLGTAIINKAAVPRGSLPDQEGKTRAMLWH